MDIRGLSYARIEQLISAGLVRTAADIFSLTRERLLELDGYAARGTDALIAAIEASKSQPLSRLLGALGIRHVGATAAQVLARHFGTLDDIAAAGRDDVLAVRGMGGVIADAVVAYFDDPSALEMMADLRKVGVNFPSPARLRLAVPSPARLSS